LVNSRTQRTGRIGPVVRHPNKLTGPQMVSRTAGLSVVLIVPSRVGKRLCVLGRGIRATTPDLSIEAKIGPECCGRDGVPRSCSARKDAKYTRGVPERGQYTIPPEVADRLPSADLSDVPPEVVAESPRDATDEEVADSLSRTGHLPRETNFGVVYRACFAPLMKNASEKPLYLRVCFVSIATADEFGAAKQAWLLVTTRGVRWHAFTDRLPGMPPRQPSESLWPPIRELRYVAGYEVGSGETQPAYGGIPVRPLLMKERYGQHRSSYLFMIPADHSTDALIDDVTSMAAQA
jgi:hypothetical protein